MTIDSTRKDDPCGPGKLLAPIRSTRLRTSVPGPVAQAALERSKQVMNNRRTFNSQLPLVVQKAHGALVYDVDGNVFIDFACAMLPTGHTPDSTLTALRNGAETLLYLDAGIGISDLELRLVEQLCLLFPHQTTKAVIYEEMHDIDLNMISILPSFRTEFIPQTLIDDYTSRHHALVIDETFSGLGRTGKLFAYEYFNLDPDAILLGRSAAAGLPFAALIGKSDFIDSLSIEAHPISALSCVTAFETIGTVMRDNLPTRALQIEALIRERINELRERYQWLGQLCGVGLALSLDVSDGARAKAIQNTTLQSGLILTLNPSHTNFIRLLPPLMIPEEQLHEGLDILEAALGAV